MQIEIQTRLELLFREFGAQIGNLIRQKHLDRYGIDPDDIEQDVRIRLWRVVERQSPISSAYVSRVVLSSVLDAIRYSRRFESESLSQDEENSPNACVIERGANPEQYASFQQFLESCLDHMVGQPKRRQFAIHMHLLGFTAEEIGKTIGSSAEAARKLVDRSVRNMRRAVSAPRP